MRSSVELWGAFCWYGLKLMVLSVFSPGVSGFFCMIIMHSSIEHLGSIMTPHLSETLSVFSFIFDPSVCGHRNSQLQSTGLQRELLQTGRSWQQVCQLLLDIHWLKEQNKKRAEWCLQLIFALAVAHKHMHNKPAGNPGAGRGFYKVLVGIFVLTQVILSLCIWSYK